MMQISCPKCQTAYSIDDGLVPPEGKKFRCAKCKYIWLAEPPAPMPPPQAPPPTPEPDPAPSPAADGEETTDKAVDRMDGWMEEEKDGIPDAVSEDTESGDSDGGAATDAESGNEASETGEGMSEAGEEAASEASSAIQEGAEIPDSIKQISTTSTYDFSFAEDAKKKSGGKTALIVIAFFIATVLGMLYASRNYVVSVFPPARIVYEAVGISFEVLGEGLEFQDIKREKIILDDISYLVVSGTIINTSEKSRPVPDILMNLLDSKDRTIQNMSQVPDKRFLTPGETLEFELRLESPSAVAVGIFITFKAPEEGKGSKGWK